jgi:hypothetical protein
MSTVLRLTPGLPMGSLQVDAWSHGPALARELTVDRTQIAIRAGAFVVAVAALGAAASTAGCGGGGSSGNNAEGDSGAGDQRADGGADAASQDHPDAGGMDGNADGSGGHPEAGPTTASVRVAHLSPDAPAFDFCFAPAGSTNFSGPFLEALGTDAGAGGLSFGQVSKYFDMPAGSYAVRIVNPQSANCDSGIIPDVDSPSLAGNFTIAIEGMLDPGPLGGVDAGVPSIGVQAYADDVGVQSGKTSIRFINASVDKGAITGATTGPMGLGYGAGVTYLPFFASTAFGAVGSAPIADGNGYLVAIPENVGTLSVRDAKYGDDLWSIDLTTSPMRAGTVYTVFSVGIYQKNLGAVVCEDNILGTGPFSHCSMAGTYPTELSARFANLAPDAPAIDFCLMLDGSNVTFGPVLASMGQSAGLAYKQVTVYVGVSAGTYTLHTVAASAGSCSGAPVIPDDAYFKATVASTYALVGQVAGPSPAQITSYPEYPGVPNGQSSFVRFINAAPGSPSLDLGPVFSGTVSSPLFTSVSFPSPATAGPAVVQDGYDISVSDLQVAGIANHPAGGATPIATNALNASYGDGYTLFAVGLVGTGGPTGIGLLACTDYPAYTTTGVINTHCH